LSLENRFKHINSLSYDSENIDGIAVSIATVVLFKPNKYICVHIFHNYTVSPVIPKVRRFGFEIY